MMVCIGIMPMINMNNLPKVPLITSMKGFRGDPIHFKVVLFMKVNGRMRCVMATGVKYGQMNLAMRDTGSMIRQTAMGNSFMLMVTSTKESGKTTKQMEKALILIVMVLNTKENGKMINSMAMVSNNGQMVQYMKDNTLKERRMEGES